MIQWPIRRVPIITQTFKEDLKKPIIPLKFEEMDLRQQGELSMILPRLIYINMTQGPGDIPRDKFEELVRKIKEHADDEEAPEPGDHDWNPP